ncbi:unnamed protein product [Lathyrus sativus]|nr:unnamed protein product [Lathyrus sativus]
MEEEEHVQIMKNSIYDDVESESQSQSEEEEALSLCDLPINEDSESLDDKSFKRNSNIRRPMSLPESTISSAVSVVVVAPICVPQTTSFSAASSCRLKS